MSERVNIAGAGVIGLMSAYYLKKTGFDVRVFDKKAKESDANCSYGNAGLIVPSHFVPLSAPGMISQGMKWMLNSRSPFYIKPRVSRDLTRWIRLFKKHATDLHMENSAELLIRLNEQSKLSYEKLFSEEDINPEYEKTGLMMLYQTRSAKVEEEHLAWEADQQAIDAEILDKSQAEQLLGCSLNVLGGVYYPGDSRLDPSALMRSMIQLLEKMGVEFCWEESIKDLRVEGSSLVEVETSKRKIEGEILVLCTGAWSPQLTSKLNLRIPIQPGRGYSFEVENPPVEMKVPAILTESKVAVTPYKNRIRFAGTLEIQSVNAKPNPKRVEGIQNAIPKYFEGFDRPENVDYWYGYRPCSPDGLPYVGKTNLQNVFVNSGHAMLGVSLAAASGDILASTIDPSNDWELPHLSPLRFNK